MCLESQQFWDLYFFTWGAHVCMHMCVYAHVCVDVNTYTLGDYAWGVQGRPAVTTEKFCNGFLSYCLRQSPIEHSWPMRANPSLSRQITKYIWLLYGPQIRPSVGTLPTEPSPQPQDLYFLAGNSRAIVFPTFYHELNMVTLPTSWGQHPSGTWLLLWMVWEAKTTG